MTILRSKIVFCLVVENFVMKMRNNVISIIDYAHIQSNGEEEIKLERPLSSFMSKPLLCKNSTNPATKNANPDQKFLGYSPAVRII